ncbi:kinase-like domain-containing protein [Lipomyces doorenjongii]|uniref:kinase-like domain-containing protein n=1 Tax=Lipomyces doorenjongii TaxID=383834 RepID=UPI0034CD898F
MSSVSGMTCQEGQLKLRSISEAGVSSLESHGMGHTGNLSGVAKQFTVNLVLVKTVWPIVGLRSAQCVPRAFSPPDLVDELCSLPNYFFDLESAHITSYESWHVLGKHVTVTETPILARISPSERSLRLEQEFAIVRHMMKLDPTSARIIRAFEFFHLQKTKAVVSIFEYLGEYSLAEFSSFMTNHEYGDEQNGDVDDNLDSTIQKRIMTLPQFLEFAIGACESLELLHQSHNIVHGEVRDDAFFYNANTRTVKIMQFGSSTRIVQTSLADSTIQDIVDNSTLDYKYVYLSPEQTGRASSCVDHRTDIYSLGIVFFSVLTSHLPFYGSAMDMIHDLLNTSAHPSSHTDQIYLRL